VFEHTAVLRHGHALLPEPVVKSGGFAQIRKGSIMNPDYLCRGNRAPAAGPINDGFYFYIHKYRFSAIGRPTCGFLNYGFDLRSRIRFAISLLACESSASSAAIKLSWSRGARFWLTFHLPSIRSTAISTPTIARVRPSI
jgi:hypothetical protein